MYLSDSISSTNSPKGYNHFCDPKAVLSGAFTWNMEDFGQERLLEVAHFFFMFVHVNIILQFQKQA